MGVSMGEVFNTLQVYLGSLYVNDFNRFGRTWQVNVQAAAEFPQPDRGPQAAQDPQRPGQDGAAWHAGQRPRSRAGPVMIMRYNMYPAAADQRHARRRASARARRSSRCERLARHDLPRSMRTEWTELALLQLADRQHGHAGLPAGRGAGVPGAGRPVRKLVAAAGGDPGGADVPAVLDRRRAVGPHGHQHLHAGRLRGAGRPGVQERDSDRRVRQGAARSRRAAATRRRWKPASCGCGRS